MNEMLLLLGMTCICVKLIISHNEIASRWGKKNAFSCTPLPTTTHTLYASVRCVFILQFTNTADLGGFCGFYLVKHLAANKDYFHHALIPFIFDEQKSPA